MFYCIRMFAGDNMRYFVLITVIIGWVLLSGDAEAETVAEFDSTRLIIIDSMVITGEIARPQICPVDSNWITYEVHLIETVQLVIYNLTSGEKRQIDPSSGDEDTVQKDSLGIRMNRDLAWRPVPMADKLWAAYVSDSSGIQEIFLSEILSGRNYRLPGLDLTDDDQAISILGTPSWSPDGKCLTYSAAIDGDADIYIVRGMDEFLNNPEEHITLQQAPLISGKGNQFGAVWCPVPGSGYLAYTEQWKGGSKFRIKVFDPLTSKTFELSELDTTIDCLAPTWNAGGNRIAYYRYGIEDGPISRFSGPEDGKLEIGVATVTIMGDSIILTPQYGGSPGKKRGIEVAPNYDRLLGPAWVPGGRHLVVTTYEEERPTRLRVMSLNEWERGETEYDYWLRGFGGDNFEFPRDLNIANRNISFTFGQAPRKYLMAGHMIPSIQLVLIPEYIEVAKNRQAWWRNYAGGGGTEDGLLKKIGDFLWSPIVGPDLGINRGIVPVAGGLVLLIHLMGGGDDEGTTVPRDWTPPEFPDAGKTGAGFKVIIGF
jgi:hypothetical protein